MDLLRPDVVDKSGHLTPEQIPEKYDQGLWGFFQPNHFASSYQPTHSTPIMVCKPKTGITPSEIKFLHTLRENLPQCVLILSQLRSFAAFSVLFCDDVTLDFMFLNSSFQSSSFIVEFSSMSCTCPSLWEMLPR
eukprot:gb/GECG01010612.1/.p1 GENE.gb/GECG01010612.1/~~gb/GECG01010612.1/.p1  ORF type:complete len:134 (+),score=4.49 gb/GECG01010612.1/:1-402(+)